MRDESNDRMDTGVGGIWGAALEVADDGRILEEGLCGTATATVRGLCSLESLADGEVGVEGTEESKITWVGEIGRYGMKVLLCTTCQKVRDGRMRSTGRRNPLNDT